MAKHLINRNETTARVAMSLLAEANDPFPLFYRCRGDKGTAARWGSLGASAARTERGCHGEGMFWGVAAHASIQGCHANTMHRSTQSPLECHKQSTVFAKTISILRLPAEGLHNVLQACYTEASAAS